jgi:hypothetical protein
MAKADQLRKLLKTTQKTSDQAQRSFLKAEDQLHALKDREARRQPERQR